MKKNYFLITFLLMTSALCAQTTHTVEAGGNPNQGSTPYFSPQFLTIDEGDIVEWNNVEGFHGIVTTSGPTSFGTSNANAPWTYSFTFTIPGVYEYECPVGSHALTQFGTITVVGSQSVADASVKTTWGFFPNPTEGILSISFGESNSFAELKVYQLTGELIATHQIQGGDSKLDLTDMSHGIYILELNFNGVIERRKLMVK